MGKIVSTYSEVISIGFKRCVYLRSHQQCNPMAVYLCPHPCLTFYFLTPLQRDTQHPG